jgi:ribonuclease G
VINETRHETRVALLEDGTLAEIFTERRNEGEITGNIYKGKVIRVLPGMQAAFIDIGLSHAAFIHADDIVSFNDPAIEEAFSEELSETPEETDEKSIFRVRKRPPIEELILEGQEIMVQVAKAPFGTKGARVTSHISLPGRFLVLMPMSKHIGVSRRIEDEKERQRLKNGVIGMKKEDFGYIVRTAAEKVPLEKLTIEMDFLSNLWRNILKKNQQAAAGSLLHQELSVSLRAVRDLMTHEVEKLVIDSLDGYQSVISFLESFMPGLKNQVEYYQGNEPIFDAYNLEGDISRALKKKVWLKSGGYIVIEQTEALVAIDVNTGRYVGKHNLEETILKTNLEAVREIAYQTRLRSIAGIIIIDFIDMEKKTNREKVYQALLEALKRDRSKTHVLPMSELGLIQMTRKRVRQPLASVLTEPCFYCEGEGKLTSKKTICYNIYREILREANDIGGVKLTLRVNPEIAELLYGEESAMITGLEKRIKRRIVIYPNEKYHLEQFDFFETAAE